LSRIELPEPNHKSAELLENILAISQENHSVDKITYKQENILVQAASDEAVAFITSTDLPYTHGIPHAMNKK
jgi:hypothetical protein